MPQGTRQVCDDAIDGVVRRPRDRPVVVQEAVGNMAQSRFDFDRIGEHRFAAEIGRGCESGRPTPSMRR